MAVTGHQTPPTMPTVDPVLLVVLVAALGSGLVVSIALAATARRRSLSYFLVTLALATLLSRSLLGVLFLDGVLDHPQHHLLEHGLDILGVTLLFGAVWAARTVETGRPADE